MEKKKTIAVGLSGGIDSAMSAYLLQKEGYEVYGVRMNIYGGDNEEGAQGRGCYGPDEEEASQGAKEVAAFLGIPLYEFDLKKEFKEYVLKNFKEEYLKGRTPNPCVRCNRFLKFGLLLEAAERELGEVAYFATGHYAKVKQNPENQRYYLKKGEDSKKDQTYFLSLLNQEQLKKLKFPLGDYIKEEVKEIAHRQNFPNSQRLESQNFIPGDSYTHMVSRKSNQGEITFKDGTVLGTHHGIWHYTIGQRRGLGIDYHEPLYVLALDPIKNRVIVGPDENLFHDELLARDINWMKYLPEEKEIELEAKIRYHQVPGPVTLTQNNDGSLTVKFKTLQRAIAPGQLISFYEGDDLVGGGIIDKV